MGDLGSVSRYALELSSEILHELNLVHRSVQHRSKYQYPANCAAAIVWCLGCFVVDPSRRNFFCFDQSSPCLNSIILPLLSSLKQCLYYESKRSFRFCIAIYLSYIVVFVGFEVGMTYAIRALLAS